MDQFVHRSPKYPWIILVISILLPLIGFKVNSYQAEDGACFKTFGLGLGLFILFGCCCALGIPTFGLGFLCALALYGFGIYHGYLVMKKSKE